MDPLVQPAQVGLEAAHQLIAFGAGLRAAELQAWIDSGTYERILNGEYTRRGQEEKERPLASDLGEAARHYAQEAKETVSQVTDAAKRAAEAFTEALKGKRQE